MRDKVTITAGLAVFLALASFPFWHTLRGDEDNARPELELPADASECIENTEYMTANHMDLLNQWRNAVVRDGQRDYTSSAGEQHVMSLTRTCMDCHSNRETFCDRCHTYADVQPTCWDCHVAPEVN
jgi:hypothetical protein